MGQLLDTKKQDYNMPFYTMGIYNFWKILLLNDKSIAVNLESSRKNTYL